MHINMSGWQFMRDSHATRELIIEDFDKIELKVDDRSLVQMILKNNAAKITSLHMNRNHIRNSFELTTSLTKLSLTNCNGVDVKPIC